MSSVKSAISRQLKRVSFQRTSCLCRFFFLRTDFWLHNHFAPTAGKQAEWHNDFFFALNKEINNNCTSYPKASLLLSNTITIFVLSLQNFQCAMSKRRIMVNARHVYFCWLLHSSTAALSLLRKADNPAWVRVDFLCIS